MSAIANREPVMSKPFFFLLLFASAGACAADAADPATASASGNPCPAIRARIAAQSGVLSQPDSVLLKEIGSHQACRFTRDEVYRAGFGERPPAPAEHHYRRWHDDDDD